jgi:hypothetical protein
VSIRFEKIWVQQCKATRGIKRHLGVKRALVYLIREKLLNFADAAEQRPEFAREPPPFLAEVWRIFNQNQYEIAGYVASFKAKQRTRRRTFLYLRPPTRGPATARVLLGDGLTGLGQEYAQSSQRIKRLREAGRQSALRPARNAGWTAEDVG